MAEKELLIPKEDYLSAGIHIGMKSKTASMKKFIYKIREDGLSVLNLKLLDERIGIGAKCLSRSKNILVVGRKSNSHKAVKKFAEIIGADHVIGRFMPGTLTNPEGEGFLEPELLIVTDPLADAQALHEAENIGIPVIGLCDTNNETKYLDLVIPTNNKGRRALALVYWLLTREILKEKGKIKSYEDFKQEVEDFEAEI